MLSNVRDPHVSTVTSTSFDLWRTGLSTFVQVPLASVEPSKFLSNCLLSRKRVVLFAGGFPLTKVGGLPPELNEHLLSHLAFSAVIISGFRGTELSQFGYSKNIMGQTETPRREVWWVSSFSRRCATSHVNMWRATLAVRLSPCVRTRVGSREAVSLPFVGCRGENNPTRDSWDYVGPPERALRCGSCFPRLPGSHCF